MGAGGDALLAGVRETPVLGRDPAWDFGGHLKAVAESPDEQEYFIRALGADNGASGERPYQAIDSLRFAESQMADGGVPAIAQVGY